MSLSFDCALREHESQLPPHRGLDSEAEDLRERLDNIYQEARILVGKMRDAQRMTHHDGPESAADSMENWVLGELQEARDWVEETNNGVWP